MTAAQTIFFALACAALYIALSLIWDRIALRVLLILFDIEYLRIARKLRKTQKQIAEYKVTPYIEPDHVKFQREQFVSRRDVILQASKREIAEARAQAKSQREGA